MSIPSSDTSTIETDGSRIDLLVARASEWLAAQLSMSQEASPERRTRYKEDMAYWHTETERLANTPGVRMPRLGAMRQRGWHIEQDFSLGATSSSRYLVLDNWRG